MSPRAGLLFTPQSSTDIKAIYSWAFRDPNSYENFYGADSSSPDSSSLKPELIRSWELDVEHRFGKTYYVSGAGFLNRIDELIVQGFDPATGNPSFSNSSPVQTKGIELELGAKWTNGIKGVVSDSVQDSSNVVTTNVLTSAPRHLAKMNLSVPLARTKFFAGVDAQYVSRRTTVAETVLGGYFVMNATFFTRQLNDRFEISGGLYNLFDRRYSESASIDEVETSIPQDGRNFRIKLTYRSRFNGR